MLEDTQKLQRVVDQLLLPPFSKRLTLVSLSELLADPTGACKLLAEVAELVRPHALSEEQQAPRYANQEEQIQAIAQYAACLVFDVDAGVTIDATSFAQQLQQPNSPQLLNLLYTMLDDISAAKQKAYVSKFKAPIAIPPDIQSQDNIQELLSQLREAQSAFSQAYEENLELLKQQTSSKIEQLQTEKAQLVGRQDKLIERVRQAKLQAVQDEAVQLCKRRREALEEVEVLKQQITQQNELRKAYLTKTQAVVNSAKGTPAGIIQACQAENARLKQELESLPQEIAEKESLRELIISDPGPEAIQQLEEELETTKKELFKLREAAGAQEGAEGASQANNLVYLRQSLAKAKRRAQELQQKHERLQADATAVDQKMKALMNTAVTAETLDQTDEIPLIAFKDLVGRGKALKAQVSRYTEDKTFLKKDAAVLTRTTEILTQICQSYGLDAAEPTNEAAMNTQNLHEARALLREIEGAIRTKRQALQPKQQELANSKRQLASLEQLLEQERAKVSQLDAGRAGQVYKLRMTLQRAQNECESVISEIYRLERVANIMKAELARASKDKEVAQLRKDIGLQQNQAKLQLADLRERQARVREGLPALLEQRKMFADLASLLRAKKDSVLRLVDIHATEGGTGQNIRLQ